MILIPKPYLDLSEEECKAYIESELTNMIEGGAYDSLEFYFKEYLKTYNPIISYNKEDEYYEQDNNQAWEAKND